MPIIIPADDGRVFWYQVVFAAQSSFALFILVHYACKEIKYQLKHHKTSSCPSSNMEHTSTMKGKTQPTSLTMHIIV